MAECIMKIAGYPNTFLPFGEFLYMFVGLVKLFSSSILRNMERIPKGEISIMTRNGRTENSSLIEAESARK